jgi:hypothetical protein
MKTYLFDMNNVFCITTAASKKIIIVDGEFASKEMVFYRLCERIVDMENAGSRLHSVIRKNIRKPKRSINCDGYQ